MVWMRNVAREIFYSSVESDEFMVSEEEYVLWHLDASCNKGVPHDRSSGFVGKAEDVFY